MIRESSVALAELIVVGGGNFRPSQVIAGLNGESGGAMAFTDNFREEILQASQGNMHTETVEGASERLGEIIRDSLTNIRTYGVPMARRVLKDTRLLYSRKQLKDLTEQLIDVQYVNVDNGFFESPLYPTEVRDKSITYTGVDLGMAKSLKWSWPDRKEILDFIGANHADLLAILDDEDECISQAANFISELDELSSLFVNKDGIYDFSQIKSVRFVLLLKMYVLLTKMYFSEDPAPWLKTGELATYRSYVSQLWNGMTLYLIKLKQVVLTYRARQLVIVAEKQPVLTAHNQAQYGDTRFMQAKLKVFYTNGILDKIQAANVGFTEAIMGYYWGALTGSPMTILEFIADVSKGQNLAKAYYSHIHEKLSTQSNQLFIKSGIKAINDFINESPVLLDRVNGLRGDNQMLISWVQEKFAGELEKAHYILADRHNCDDVAGEIVGGADDGGDPRLDTLLETRLIPSFLRACGASLTADIIESTFVDTSKEDNVMDKRERLTVAVITELVNRLLEA
jgi:hypothetical protein